MIRCPECGSKHYRSMGIIRSGSMRAPWYNPWSLRFVSEATGDHAVCMRCKCEFAATDEGCWKMNAPAPATNATERSPMPDRGPPRSQPAIPKERPQP